MSTSFPTPEHVADCGKKSKSGFGIGSRQLMAEQGLTGINASTGLGLKENRRKGIWVEIAISLPDPDRLETTGNEPSRTGFWKVLNRHFGVNLRRSKVAGSTFSGKINL